jgi:competence protein ComEA
VEPSSAPWRVLESNESAPPAPEAGTRGRPWLAIGAAVLAVAVAGAAILFAARPEPVIGVDGAGNLVAGSLVQGSPPPTEPPTEPTTVGGGAAGAGAAGAPVVVEVGGAVARPGVYRLPAGARVADAIAAAGGFGARVDVEAADRALNLASLVRDGDEIHVPARGEAAASATAGDGSDSGGVGSRGVGGASAGGAGGTSAGGLIDLNRATAEQLDTLPGVGPATAAKIIAAREERPFASLEDVGSRKVVGAATLAKIRALVTVGP